MEEGLHAHLDGEEDAQKLVAAAVGSIRHGAREDISEGKEALGKLVVRAVEVEEREDDGLERRGGRYGREMRREILAYTRLAGLCLALLAQRGQAAVEEAAQTGAKGREDAAGEVRQEDGAGDVGGAGAQAGQGERRGGVDLDEVAVFLAEGAVAGEGGEGEVEEGGGGAQLRGEGVGGAGAEEAAVEVGEGVCEVAGEVGVFLVGADDVGGCGEGVGRCGGCGWG